MLNRIPVCGPNGGIHNCKDYIPMGEGFIIQVPGTGPQNVPFEYVFNEEIDEADFGYIKVDDLEGTIGNLKPGDPGYISAATSRETVIFERPYPQSTTVTFNGGDYLMFYLKTFQTFYTLKQLNPDSFTHVLTFFNLKNCSLQFCWEGWAGGRDYCYSDAIIDVFMPQPNCPVYNPQGDVSTVQVPGTGDKSIIFKYVYMDYRKSIIYKFKWEFGYIKVDSSTGTLDGKEPGDMGYEWEALQRKQPVFTEASTPDTPDVNRHFTGGEYLMFYVLLADYNFNPGPLITRFFSISLLNNSFQSMDAYKNNVGNAIELCWSDRSHPYCFAAYNMYMQDIMSMPPIVPICGGAGEPVIKNCKEYIPMVNGAVIQVPGTGIQTVRFEYVLRDSGYNNEFGIIKVDDAAGTVGSLKPGDTGYLQAAFGRSVTIFDHMIRPPTTDINLSFNGGEYFMLYLIANSDKNTFLHDNPENLPSQEPNAYFSLVKLNPDKMGHALAFEKVSDCSLQFCWEDLLGGGDFSFDDDIYNIYMTQPDSPIYLPLGNVSTVQVPGRGNKTIRFSYNYEDYNKHYVSRYDWVFGYVVVDSPTGTIDGKEYGDSDYTILLLRRMQPVFGYDSTPDVADVTRQFTGGEYLMFYISLREPYGSQGYYIYTVYSFPWSPYGNMVALKNKVDNSIELCWNHGSDPYYFAAYSMYLPQDEPVTDLDSWISTPGFPLRYNGLTPLALTGVVYGLGAFYAVGYKGRILVSDDSVHWNNSSIWTTDTFCALACGGGRLVAAGLNGAIVTSENGYRWGKCVLPTDKSVFAVTYAKSMFVAAGQEGTVLVSTDSLSWKPVNTGTRKHLLGIAYGNNTFVVVGGATGEKGVILSSDTGKTWTARDSGAAKQLFGVVYGDGIFVALGESDGAKTPVCISSDGKTWIGSNIVNGGNMNAITYGNGIFIAVNTAGGIFTSPDGYSWQKQSSNTKYGINAINYVNGRFVAVGDYGQTLCSSDGIDWTNEFTDLEITAGINEGTKFTAILEDPSVSVQTIEPNSMRGTAKGAVESYQQKIEITRQMAAERTAEINEQWNNLNQIEQIADKVDYITNKKMK